MDKLEKNYSGLMSARGVLEFQKIIFEQVIVEFKPAKEEHLLKRVEAYKVQDWKTYMDCIRNASIEM